MREIIIGKAPNGGEDIVIKIEDIVPNLCELEDLYDYNSYFKLQAKKLSGTLFTVLPYGTVTELVTDLTKKLYRLNGGYEK